MKIYSLLASWVLFVHSGFAQVVVSPRPPQAGALPEASPALRAEIAAAAAANGALPSNLAAYRAQIESEFSMGLRDTLGLEKTLQLEQLSAVANWQRARGYRVHVVGYRSRSVGSFVSAASMATGWTVPMLYGDRLRIGVEFDAQNDSSAPTRIRDTLVAVHPFATDRDTFYRFGGGDTIAVLQSDGRKIPIIRLRVTPRRYDTTGVALFDGEIELDASLHQIVRMRGRVIMLPARRPFMLRVSGVVAAVFIEFVNAEVDQHYWLPAFERTEFQIAAGLVSSSRFIFRITSRFRDYTVDTGSFAAADSGSRDRERLTWGVADSLNRFKSWAGEIGEQTARVQADDFAEYAPDSWRPTGRPRLSLTPSEAGQLFRFNRVEGVYTGVSAALLFRDLAPGLALGGDVGWAWSEQAPRGGAHIQWNRGPWRYGLYADRRLSSTNDFAPPFATGNALLALIASLDEQDYVDRRLAAVSVTRTVRSLGQAVITLQLAGGNDRSETARLNQGLFRADSGFRRNRASVDGRYQLGILDAAFHPDVIGDFLQPGVGARFHCESAVGELEWQRLELTLVGRRYAGPLTFVAHADAGAVLGGSPPPQQLFELGENATLPGYNYKQFAGDRAMLARAFASYTLPLMRKPIQVWRSLALPGVTPGFSASLQAGWTGISSPAAANAVSMLTPWSSRSESSASRSVRTTALLGLTSFSGVLQIGLARAVDHPDHWKLSARLGQTF